MSCGEPFHGERIFDSAGSGTLTIVLLYKSGSITAYTLGPTEVLHITHATILCVPYLKRQICPQCILLMIAPDI